MPGGYRDNPDKDPNGDDLPPFVQAPDGHFKGALITHNGDIYGGDGLQDLVVRLGSKLWVYPGDGYGAVNIDKRREILLPEGAPSPSALTQIVSGGFATRQGYTDFFATIGDELWVFTGYHGATIDRATRLWASGWTNRDLVIARDVSGDSVTDLIFRDNATGKLWLRKGIAAAEGGVDLASLGNGGSSAGGTDTEYGASGWGNTNMLHLMGTPDVNGDSIPDLWAVRSDGTVRVYSGGRTSVVAGSGKEVIGAAPWWQNRIAVG